METTKTKFNGLSLRVILFVIAIGIWAIVLQNAGVIPTNQNVRVVNTVDTYVNGGDIDVSGSVSVDNEVDINISSVNGYNAKSYGNGHLGVSVY